MFFNLLRYFSLRYLFLHPFRNFLTFLGVALGISLFLSIVLINDATKRSLNNNIEAMTGKADLTITSDGMGFEESILSEVQKIKDVKQIVPIIINTAFLNNPKDAGNKGPVVFLGIDLLKDSAVRSYNAEGGGDIVPDPLAFLNQADSIIATKSWTKKNKLGMEDPVELLTKEGIKSFSIRGIIDDAGPAQAFEGNMAIMDIDGARYNFGREGLYDRADILLYGDRPLAEVKQELKDLLGGRFRVEDKKEQSAAMEQMVKSIQEVSGLLGLLAFLVGFLIIVNTVNTAISQRRKDIGSLRTFGASNMHIIFLFAGEFLSLALASSLFGCWLGVQFANHSMNEVAQGLNSSLMTNINNMSIVFTGEHLFAGMMLSLISSITALVYPMYKALQIHPIEAIKPTTLDFTMSKKPKVLILTFLGGLFLFLFTIAITNYSAYSTALQSKDLQPVFLISGLAGIVLMGPYLVLTILSTLHKLPLPFLLKFALGNLLKNPSRTASTSVHLSLAFTLVLMISAINISFKKTIINWSREITSSGSVINITSWGSVAGFQIQALHESLKEKLEKLPNLNPAISTPVTAVRVIPINILGERYMIKAYDNPGTSEYYKFIVPITGDRDEMAKKLYNEDEQNILVSEQFLKRFNKQVGDVFEMETPSGLAQFTMAGLIREFGSPNGVIYFHRKLYKKYWKDDLVSLFSIHHSPEISSADYLAKVGPDLNQKEHLQAEFPSKIAEDVEKNIENNMAMSDSTKWIALIIGTMGLLNSFLIALLQRFRELGCIRSIGMTKAQMIGMVLSECVTLGFTGVLMSFLLTLPVAYCWVNYTLTFLLGWKVDYYFEGSDYALFMGIGLFVSLVAGIFPAMRAARLKLREALEYE